MRSLPLLKCTAADQPLSSNLGNRQGSVSGFGFHKLLSDFAYIGSHCFVLSSVGISMGWHFALVGFLPAVSESEFVQSRGTKRCFQETTDLLVHDVSD